VFLPRPVYSAVIFALACGLTFAACERKDDAPKEGATSEAAEQIGTEEGGTTAPSAAGSSDTAGSSEEHGVKTANAESSEDEKLALASPKEPANPDASKVGTLPEGVGLEPGSKVPEFEARGLDGEPVTNADLFKKDEGHKLVVFYRGGW